MFKILAVVCTLGGDCFPFLTEDIATYPTLAVCDQHAHKLAHNLHDTITTFAEFKEFRVGCVSSDFKLN